MEKYFAWHGIFTCALMICACGDNEGDTSFNTTDIFDVMISNEPKFDAGCIRKIEMKGKTFTCPMLQIEADAHQIVYSRPYIVNKKSYIGMNRPQANEYCNKLGGGYRLPTKDELDALYQQYGNMSAYAGWPTSQGLDYWSSTRAPSGGYYYVDLSNGAIDINVHDETNDLVACIRDEGKWD